MPQSSRRLALLVAGLAAIAPFSIDTYLPAFPAMVTALKATEVEVQQTLTAFLLPFAFMMLWHGALSDALGRRRVILVGLGFFVLASLLCVFAGNIETLWLGRALQGMSAGAGLSVGRALIRDLFEGAAAQRLMSQVSLIFAAAPALAPIIGGVIHAYFDWRAIFVFLVLFGAAIWLACWRWLPETLPPERRQSLHPVSLARSYRSVFGNREFVTLSASLALNFSGIFLYVMAAPVFLIRHLGLTAQGFAWLFTPTIGGMMVGAYFSGRMAGRVSQARTIAIGSAVMFLAAAANLALNLAWPPGLPWSLLPLPLYAIGMALVTPSLQLMALDLFPEKRGLASSCQSTMQTGSNALTAALLVPLLWDSTLNLAYGMAGFLLLGLGCFAIWQHHRV